ncbi:hypothetical protein O3Q48_07640 [Enterococcus lactis]
MKKSVRIFFIKEPLVLFFMENIRKPYQIFSTLEKDGTKTKRKHDKVNTKIQIKKKRGIDMPKEDIANSPDYRQETLLDKMINEIKDPTTKDLVAQLRDNINVMESTPKHGKHTPEYKIVEDNKVYAKAELKASKLREELKTRAPEILKTFDNTRKTMAKQKTQQKQKEQSFKKQEAKQETSLNDFKSLLAKQTNNLKQCKR